MYHDAVVVIGSTITWLSLTRVFSGYTFNQCRTSQNGRRLLSLRHHEKVRRKFGTRRPKAVCGVVTDGDFEQFLNPVFTR